MSAFGPVDGERTSGLRSPPRSPASPISRDWRPGLAAFALAFNRVLLLDPTATLERREALGQHSDLGDTSVGVLLDERQVLPVPRPEW